MSQDVISTMYSRKILPRGLSNSQDAKWCKQVLEKPSGVTANQR